MNDEWNAQLYSFPHYTWGCIVAPIQFSKRRLVPSPYVRVYLWLRKSERYLLRSLTIREGISSICPGRLSLNGFPHHTWGYIGQPPADILSPWVPSLHVRVYRPLGLNWQVLAGSLTTREGVSRLTDEQNNCGKFPHYTWGCITWACHSTHAPVVPSPYVRVYRKEHLYIRKNKSSLTIREGISANFDGSNAASSFPHYTWGCITAEMPSILTMSVPSLYVSVC